MYKCKECGAEFEIKPDYCDCGNDEFEEKGVNVNIEQSQDSSEFIEKGVNIDVEHSQGPSEFIEKGANAGVSTGKINLRENINNGNVKFEQMPENTPKMKIESEPVSSTSNAGKFSYDNNFSLKYRHVLSVDPVSLTIFLICILFSLYVIFFAWNIDDEVNTDEKILTKNEGVETDKNIPAIDKFWNNTPPAAKVEPKKEEKTEPVENIPKAIQQVLPIKKTVESKKVNNTPKTTTIPLKKVTNSAQKAQPVQQKSTVVKPQNKTSDADAAKKKAEQERLAAEEAQLKKLRAEQAKKAEAEKAKQSEAAKQELITYKAQLRNAIGKKIDFARVIGDGSCTVAFRVDSNGKLVNRSFAKQSSNNTLNDAVYAAVMATPTFNPPPSAYNNEILNLNIKFSNGNFEISLP